MVFHLFKTSRVITAELFTLKYCIISAIHSVGKWRIGAKMAAGSCFTSVSRLRVCAIASGVIEII